MPRQSSRGGNDLRSFLRHWRHACACWLTLTRSTRQLGHGFDKHIEVGPDENFAEFLAEDLSQPKAASHSTDAAAMDALPHEHPKLSAIAMGSVSGQDFAAILDRAILRSRGNGRNVPQIDLKAEQESS
jgi:hypothetical protein